MDKPYFRHDQSDILKSVERFVEYHDDLHQAVIARPSTRGALWNSLDRGTFSRPILPKEILHMLGGGRRSSSFAYGPEIGDEVLRGKIASLENEKHGTDYSSKNIAIMPGAWAGLEFALEHIMVKDGGDIDQKSPILVIGPTLNQMFHRPIQKWGLHVVSHDYTMAGARHVPSMEDVDSMFEENPSIIVITNPNNPDGLYIPNNVLEAIIQEAKSRGVFVIVDEIQNCFPNKEKLQYGSWIQEKNVLRVDGPAKRYSLAEYRQGWMIGDPELLGDRMHGIIGCMSGLMGNAPRAANTALFEILKRETDVVRGKIGSVLEGFEEELLEKERMVEERLAAIDGVAEILPRDGCINRAFRSDFEGTDMQLAKNLMTEGKTLLMPASGYGYRPEDSVLRLTFAEKNARIEEGLKDVQSILDK